MSTEQTQNTENGLLEAVLLYASGKPLNAEQTQLMFEKAGETNWSDYCMRVLLGLATGLGFENKTLMKEMELLEKEATETRLQIKAAREISKRRSSVEMRLIDDCLRGQTP